MMTITTMIKRLFLALATIGMVTAPIAASANDRHRDHDRRIEYRERRGGINTGEAIAIGLGAIILGSAISNSNRRDRRGWRNNEYVPPNHRYDTRYCVREQIVEWHRGERYVFWETRCN